jgi:MFS family permease
MIGIGTGAVVYQYVASLFLTALEAEYGWSRSQVVTIGALALVGAFSAPFMGRIADRYGIRLVAIASILTIAIAYIGLASTNGSMAQVIPLMLLFGIAAPGTAGIVYSRAIASWFDEHRGMALGLMSSGISISVLIVNTPIAWLIEAHGFRSAYLALAAMALVIGLPVVWRGLRLNPNEARTDQSEDVATTPMVSPTVPLASILVMPRFWLLAFTMLLFNAPAAGILTQLAPLLQGRGLTLAEGGLLFSLFSVSVLAGRLLVGWAFDRYSPPHIAAMVTFAAAFGVLAFLDTAPIVTIIPGIIAVGLVQGSESDVVAYFIGRIFPPAAFSTVYGLTMTGTMTGTAIGVIAFGALYDHYGDYDVPLMIGAVMLLMVAGLYLSMLRYFRARQER